MLITLILNFRFISNRIKLKMVIILDIHSTLSTIRMNLGNFNYFIDNYEPLLHRFIIGSPKGSSKYYNTPKTGVAFICSISNLNGLNPRSQCNELNVFENLDTGSTSNLNNTIDQGSFIGGTIGVQPRPSGSLSRNLPQNVVICGPTWVNYVKRIKRPTGRCFTLTIENNAISRVFDLLPLG